MSNREGIFKKLIEAVDLGDEDLAEEGANEALEDGIPPYDAIILGLAEGMKLVGDKYERKEYFLPDMLLSADAMYAGLNILTPHIPKESTRSKGKIILGVVEGDVHAIHALVGGNSDSQVSNSHGHICPPKSSFTSVSVTLLPTALRK